MILASLDIGRRNLALCVLEGDRIIDWHVFDLGQRRGVSLIREMQRQFKDRQSLSAVDVCVVERQPAANPQMRVIEAAVEAYFVFHGVGRVVDYSPRHKLSHLSGVMTYSQRKRASVREAEKYLVDHPQPDMARLFRSSRKKDDLADALMQALHFKKDPSLENEVVEETPGYILAREPKDKGNRGKPFSRSQVKWFIQRWVAEGSGPEEAIIEGHLPKHSRVRRSIERWWSSLQECLDHVNIPRPARTPRVSTGAEPDSEFATNFPGPDV
jgi:hypothetical protein